MSRSSSVRTFLVLLVGYACVGIPYTTLAAASPEDAKSVADSINAFAFDLYPLLAKSCAGNLVFSPYSIETALAMTCVGARGQTALQMATVLHFSLPSNRWYAAHLALLSDVNRTAYNYRLNIANCLWGQRGVNYKPEFLRLLQSDFDSPFEVLDFDGAPDSARKTINEWVTLKTEHIIPELIQPGILDSATRLVLINTIYFKGVWESRFVLSQTKELPFYFDSTHTTPVSLMAQEGTFPYMKNHIMRMVELPYAGGEQSMVVILPTADGMSSLERNLNSQILHSWLSQLRPCSLSLYLPRLRLADHFELKDSLSEMGMPDAFDGNADFSGIAESASLRISHVVHSSATIVDENGTLAAAATAVLMGPLAMGSPLVFRADHPFLFFILQRQPKVILFMGRIVNPANDI